MHLPNADYCRLVRAYREFLIRATASRWLDRLEGLLNFVCPKSIIVYGEKRAEPNRAATSTSSTDGALSAAA